MFGLSELELVVYGFFSGILILFVGIPSVLILRYLNLAADLRVLGRRSGIDRWLAVPAALLSVGTVVAFALAGDGNGMGNDMVAIGGGVFVVGVFLVTMAVANYDWYQAVQNLPHEATGSALDGPVQVTGQAQPLDGTLVGPISDEPCLAYEVTVRERRERWLKRGFRTAVATDAVAVPFVVDDGSGEVVVDADEVTVRPKGRGQRKTAEVSLNVDAGDLPPPHVQQAARELGIGASSNQRRYIENSIRPGDTVHVVGSCDSTDPAFAGYRAIGEGSDVPCSVATVGVRESVWASLHTRVRRGSAAGVVLTIAGLVGMAWAL